MHARLSWPAVLALLCTSSLASANDGDLDTDGAYPAVGFYHVAYRYPGQPLETYGGCSGTLIAPDRFLTAGHCTFYDSRRLVETPAYERADAWVSLDPIVTDNDFRCFLRELGHPGADALACDEATRGHPTFHRALSAGITHPDYPTFTRNGIHELFGANDTDVAVLLLAQPVAGVAPLQVAARGALDGLDPRRLRLLGVGYGLDYHKFTPATPDEPGTSGPTTFQGGYGYRRIADLGAIRSITPTRITPMQRNALGDDSLCYWDSGSPLFVVADGVVDPTVVGVLTGGAMWCMGAWDPYQRVDLGTAADFLACVAGAPDLRAACLCGAEATLGLCD